MDYGLIIGLIAGVTLLSILLALIIYKLTPRRPSTHPQAEIYFRSPTPTVPELPTARNSRRFSRRFSIPKQQSQQKPAEPQPAVPEMPPPHSPETCRFVVSSMTAPSMGTATPATGPTGAKGSRLSSTGYISLHSSVLKSLTE